mgnify:CR=1 FL=1
MATDQTIKDIALAGVISDLFTQGRILDMELQNDAALESRDSAYHALMENPSDPAVLSAIDPTMAGGMKWGEDYAGMAPNLRVGVSQRMCASFKKDLETGCVMSQESLSDITRSVAGRLALKAGIVGGTILTVGVYKRQLIELLSDAIAELSLIAANVKEQKILIGKRVKATPKQVARQLSLIKGIVAETDKLQKTVVDIGASKLSPDVARTQVSQSIGRMMSYGVPIDKQGAAAKLTPEAENPYTAEDAEKANWDSAAINAVSASVSQIESQVKLANMGKEMAGDGHPEVDSEMKALALQAQRAVTRGAHYALYQVRSLIRVIHNLKFVYGIK